MLEQFEILRRIAERGKQLAESTNYIYMSEPTEFIDIFVHLLDEIERLKRMWIRNAP